MKKVGFWRGLIYSLFAKNDARATKKSDELSQPDGVKGGKPLTADAKNDKRNKLLKKLGIWAFILLIVGGIIAIIVVFATRKTQEYVNNPTVTYVNASASTDNKPAIDFKDSKNGTEYIVPLESNSLLATYYRGTSNQIQLKLQPTSGLPIVVDVSRTQSFTSGTSSFVYSIGQSTLTVTQSNNNVTDSNISNNFTDLNSFAKLLNQAYNEASMPPSGFNWWGLFSILMPIIVLILLLWMSNSMMKKQMGGGQDSIFGMGKTNLKPTKTSVRFTDVAGIDEVETELKEIVDYVKRPQKYAAMGARAPKGVMLYGPPGTGKTLIAKAVAGEANCSFYAIAGSAFEDMLVGVGAKRVRDLFTKARKDAPSIIFIDEIDSVASKRGKNDIMGGGGVADQTINQLLAEMDGFTTDSGVVVIAATNRLDVLDEAILRPGRFDRQIQVSLPDIKGREAILKIHARNKNLSSKVDLKDVARRTPGFSGAQLENVLNEATLLAVRENKTVISMDDIDEAIDRTIGGPARKGRVITETERRQIAYHEAGHALVGLHTKDTDVVQKITIIPRGNAGGYTLQTPAEQEMMIQRKSALLNQVRMTLGGRASEEIVFGKENISTGASNDLYKVSNIVRAMVLQLGMSSKMGLTQYVPSEGQQPYQKLYSEQTAREIDETIESIIQREYQKAKDIIITNRKELDLIVETLLVLETIVKEQIDYIHENLKLPPEVLNSNKSNMNDSASNDNNDNNKDDESPKDEPSNDNNEPKSPNSDWKL